MKQINGYWVDDNNNRWDCELYSKAEAKRYSKTLIDCTNCIDCTDCKFCDYCNYCKFCDHCDNCKFCDHCNYCKFCDHCDNCKFCDYCNYCKFCDHCDNCKFCDHCNYCDYCNYCDNCYNCDNFKTNPQIYKTREIGSRNSQTTFYYGETDKGMEVQVVCGCFRGNLEEFETAVMKTHKNCDEYREQYLREIEKVKVLFDLN